MQGFGLDIKHFALGRLPSMMGEWQTDGLGRQVSYAQNIVGSGGGYMLRGCTGFDGIVGGQVSEPCPRGT